MSFSKLHHTRAAPSVFIDYDIIKGIKGELKIIKLIFERTARWYDDNFIFMDDKVNPCGIVAFVPPDSEWKGHDFPENELLRKLFRDQRATQNLAFPLRRHLRKIPALDKLGVQERTMLKGNGEKRETNKSVKILLQT